MSFIFLKKIEVLHLLFMSYIQNVLEKLNSTYMFGKTWGTILLQIYLNGPYDPYPPITPIITNDSILELK